MDLHTANTIEQEIIEKLENYIIILKDRHDKGIEQNEEETKEFLLNLSESLVNKVVPEFSDLNVNYKSNIFTLTSVLFVIMCVLMRMKTKYPSEKLPLESTVHPISDK